MQSRRYTQDTAAKRNIVESKHKRGRGGGGGGADKRERKEI